MDNGYINPYYFAGKKNDFIDVNLLKDSYGFYNEIAVDNQNK